MVHKHVSSFSLISTLLRSLFWLPWGIVLPLAVVLCACAVYYFATSSQRLAAQWSQQMEVAPDSQVPEFAAAIAELDTAGLPSLVDGLASKRYVVRLTAQHTIDQLCDDWESLPQEKSNHRQRRLVESFERKWYQLPLSSREFAVQVAKKILITQNNTDDTDVTDNNRNKNRVDRIAVAVICADICQKINQTNDISPQSMEDIDPSGNRELAGRSVAADDEFFPVRFDRFATERAVLLTKVQQTPEWQLAKNQVGRTLREELAMVADMVEQAPITSLAGTMNLAFVRSTDGGIFPFGDVQGVPSGPQSPFPTPVDRNGAAMIAATEPLPMMVSDIGYPFAENPHNGNSTEGIPPGSPQPTRPPAIDWNEMERLTTPTTNRMNRATGTPSSAIPPTPPLPQSNSNSNFDVPLEDTPLGRIPSRLYDTLTTAELMRLLQHPDVSKLQTARRILQERDRFDDSHLQLAQRIFHPNPQIRSETANVLLDNPTLNPAPWLILLTRDTDPNVRLTAFSLIATSRETQWATQVMRQAKEDTDERIVLLGSRYEELYR